jgi:hypothetical protein
VEQQLQERELELRKAARERDDTRQELSKAQQVGADRVVCVVGQ